MSKRNKGASAIGAKIALKPADQVKDQVAAAIPSNDTGATAGNLPSAGAGGTNLGGELTNGASATALADNADVAAGNLLSTRADDNALTNGADDGARLGEFWPVDGQVVLDQIPEEWRDEIADVIGVPFDHIISMRVYPDRLVAVIHTDTDAFKREILRGDA